MGERRGSQSTHPTGGGADQHGFPHGHSTISALTAAFDTVNHNVLLSKIERSTLP